MSCCGSRGTAKFLSFSCGFRCSKEVPLLLPGGEDLGMLEPPAAAPAGACATAPAPSPPLSSEDMKVQAAKQAIARLYAEPASVGERRLVRSGKKAIEDFRLKAAADLTATLSGWTCAAGFNLGGQRVLQPEGLGAVDFFSSAQSQGAGKQQQQSGGAGWANWSSFAASPYPVAPAPASCVPAFGSFSSASISFPPQGFASAAAPPPPSAWIAGCAVDPWAEGSRMGGGGAASLGAAVRPSGFPQTQPSSTKSPPQVGGFFAEREQRRDRGSLLQVLCEGGESRVGAVCCLQEPLSALNSLDAFALARKVQQGGQSANPSPLQQASFVGGKEGGNLQTTFGASQGEAHRPAAAPAAQQDTLLLI